MGVTDFGLYSLSLSIAAFIFNCTDMRLQEAAVRFLAYPDRDDEMRVHGRFQKLFVVDIAMRSFAFLAICAISHLLARSVVSDVNASGLIVLSAAMLLLSKAGNLPATGVLRAIDKFEWSAWLTMSDWAGRLVITVIIAVITKLTITGVLVVALLVSGLINILTVVVAVAGWRTLRHGKLGDGKLGERDPQFWRFVRSCFGISLSDSATRELDTTLVGWTLGVQAVAIYKMSKNFAFLIWRAGDPVFLVIMPEFSRILREGDRAALLHLLKRVAAVLGAAAIVLYLVSVAANPLVVHYLLGKGFDQVIIVFPVMVSFVLIAMPLLWTHALFAASDQPHVQLRANILGNLMLVALLLFLAHNFGVVGAAAGWAAGVSVTFLLSAYFLWRQSRLWEF